MVGGKLVGEKEGTGVAATWVVSGTDGAVSLPISFVVEVVLVVVSLSSLKQIPKKEHKKSTA